MTSAGLTTAGPGTADPRRRVRPCQQPRNCALCAPWLPDGAQLQVDGAAGVFETTPMLSHPDTGRYYARGQVTGTAPATAGAPAEKSFTAFAPPASVTVKNADGGTASLPTTAVATRHR